MIICLQDGSPFPPVELARRTPNGLLAAGGSLAPARLLDAYRHGIFPWYSEEDPILWWCPDPRTVLFPGEFRISHSLRRTLRSGIFEIRTDTAFEPVIRQCAAPRPGQPGTWIHEEMIAAYIELHRQGYAHSVEAWKDGELAGGLYGLAIGRLFCGESMFTRQANASKVALAHLSAQLLQWNFGMIDCQMNTSHLTTLGAREIPRAEFLQRLQELVNYPDIASPWYFDNHEFAA